MYNSTKVFEQSLYSACVMDNVASSLLCCVNQNCIFLSPFLFLVNYVPRQCHDCSLNLFTPLLFD